MSLTRSLIHRIGKASSCVDLLIVCDKCMASLFLQFSSLVTTTTCGLQGVLLGSINYPFIEKPLDVFFDES